LDETGIRGHGDGDRELLGLRITGGALDGDHGGNGLEGFLRRVDGGMGRWGDGGRMRGRSLLRVDGRGGGCVERRGVVGWWRWI